MLHGSWLHNATKRLRISYADALVVARAGVAGVPYTRIVRVACQLQRIFTVIDVRGQSLIVRDGETECAFHLRTRNLK